MLYFFRLAGRVDPACCFEEVTDSNLFRLKATDGQEHLAGKKYASVTIFLKL